MAAAVGGVSKEYVRYHHLNELPNMRVEINCVVNIQGDALECFDDWNELTHQQINLCARMYEQIGNASGAPVIHMMRDCVMGAGHPRIPLHIRIALAVTAYVCWMRSMKCPTTPAAIIELLVAHPMNIMYVRVQQTVCPTTDDTMWEAVSTAIRGRLVVYQNHPDELDYPTAERLAEATTRAVLALRPDVDVSPNNPTYVEPPRKRVCVRAKSL